MIRNGNPSGVWDTLYSQHDRLFADKVMTEADWERRRKATHRHRLQPVTLARVVLGYFPLLMWAAVLSAAVGIYDITLVRWYHWPMLSMQSVQTFFSAITFALTLLLVFKTNSSYSRWWEARKDVGQLVSLVHDVMRQAVAYFPPHQAQLIHAMARWCASVMWVVKAMVRPGSHLREELEGVLAPEELTWLLAQPHKQLALGQALSSIVAAADIEPMTKTQLDAMLTRYVFEFGACGRIYNTAIPSAYTRHTSRFLMCYILIGLPLLLWPLAGWSSPVLAVLISFLLLGVENIGAFIEEPFHVIAFDRFCSAVQRDVQNILAMHDNSQCPCGAIRTGPQALLGGNVPVVRDLTHHPIAAVELAGPGFSRPGPAAAAGFTPQAVQQQRHAAPAGPAANKTGAQQIIGRSDQTELTVLPVQQQPSKPMSAGQRARQLHQQPEQEEVQLVSAEGKLRPSDSKTCLLPAHGHRE